MPYVFVSTEEFEQYKTDPKVLCDKAQQYIKGLNEQLETEKAHRQAEKVNQEHVVHKLEKDYLTCQQELEKITQQYTKLKKDFENASM